MADLQSFPRESNYETSLTSEITAADTSFVVGTAPQFSLSAGETTYVTLNRGLSNQEVILLTGPYTAGNLTLGGGGAGGTITRAQPEFEGDTAAAQNHGGGSKVIISNNWNVFNEIATVIGGKFDTAGGTLTGSLDFSGATTKFTAPTLTTIERLALTPTNGDLVFDTDLGQLFLYDGGAWSALDTGASVPNASTTVAGVGQVSTTAKADAGDDSGSTGAVNWMPPSETARVVQDAKYTYAADAEASDAYAITLTPAVTAYAEGQVFYFKANTINTGPATLNVNALGAKTIKKNHDTDLVSGDIESGQIVEVSYDGTDFQMLSPSAIGAADFIAKTELSSQAATGNASQASGIGVFSFSGDIDMDLAPFDGTDKYTFYLDFAGYLSVTENPGVGRNYSPFHIRREVFWDASLQAIQGADVRRTNLSTGVLGAGTSPYYANGASNVGAADISLKGQETWPNIVINVSGFGTTAALTITIPTWSGTNFRISWAYSGTVGGSNFSNMILNTSVMGVQMATN